MNLINLGREKKTSSFDADSCRTEEEEERRDEVAVALKAAVVDDALTLCRKATRNQLCSSKSDASFNSSQLFKIKRIPAFQRGKAKLTVLSALVEKVILKSCRPRGLKYGETRVLFVREGGGECEKN